MFLSIFILLISLLSIIYALSYANWEKKQKNKAGAIMIYITALTLFILSLIQLFN